MTAIDEIREHAHSHVVLEFDPPENISSTLKQIEEIWNGLKLMRTDMPLSDDFDLALLHDHTDRILIIDVIDQTLGLCIESAGYRVAEAYGEALAGRYLENLDSRAPLDNLWIQCMAAIKDRRPVYYCHEAGRAYDRLVLPLWGDSRVEKLISAVSEAPLRRGEDKIVHQIR